MNKTKTVIIGGGIAGLTAGNYLARKGIQTVLFEANDKPGGSCATTTLNGYTFNDGAMYLAFSGLLDHAFARLGLKRSLLLPLRKITANQTTILPDGSTVTTGDGLDMVVQRAGNDVNAALLQRELHQMVEKWEPVRQLFANDILTRPLSLPRLLVKAWRHAPKFRGTVASELNARISDESARATLASMMLFAGVSAERLPITLMPGLVALMSEGLYLPEGGMGKIPEALGQSMVDNGGELVLNADVQQIVVRNGRVQGVQVAGHGFVEADAVISTASGMITFTSLIKPEDRPRKLHKKAQNAPLSHTALSIQLGLRNKLDVASHLNSIVPLMADQRQVFTFTEDKMRWLNYSVPTVTMPDLAPSGSSIVEMFVPVANGGNVNSWDEEKKERVAALAIEALSRRHELDIVVKRIRSPKDFEQTMRLYRGTLYGLSPAASPRMQFPNQSPISGLYLAGQTTYPGFGISSVAMSGIFAAEAALKNRSE